jgi:septal ring factor EnvC (AmiA/AmiB activator)
MDANVDARVGWVPLRHPTFRALRAGCAGGAPNLRIIVASLFLALTPSLVPAAPDAATTQRKLEQARARIGELETRQASDLDRRGRALRELRDAEREAARAARALREAEQALAVEQRAFDKLKGEQKSAEQALAAERGALARQMRAAYATGREEKLKLLLNQQDPAALQRMLAYYDYFSTARRTRIERVNELIASLARLGADIEAKVAVLDARRKERAQVATELAVMRDARSRLVRELDKDIRDRKQRLARVTQEAQRLGRLLDSLDDVFKDIPPDAGGPQRAFSRSRGQLPWPASGRVLANFGEQRPEGRLRWEGMLIGAEVGAPVRAVSRGRVAYADWLPHYGLLVILEHGDGYLSLYGHNQQLHKRAGDWVERGEVIANIGDSGGQQRAALYFEIRQGKQPQDPRRWMVARR